MTLKVKLIANLVLICSLLMACQKGKKVESEATVYSDNITLCEQYAKNLKESGVDLDSREIQAKLGKFSMYPPHILPENADIETVDNLENYIIIAEKTSKLIDEKVVVFPNKNQFFRRLKLAYYFLGESNSNLSNFNDRPFISAQVDYAEYAYQFKKADQSKAIVDNAHIPYDANTRKMGSLKNFDTVTLKKIRDESLSACNRDVRMKLLASRSDWNSKEYSVSLGENLMKREMRVLRFTFNTQYYCDLYEIIREKIKE